MLNEAKDTEIEDNLEKLLTAPIALWLPEASIDDTVERLEEGLRASKYEDAIPVFVAYNIPDRDLGEGASGGAEDADSYLEWTTAVSETIADQPAVMVLEPDALPDTLSMSPEAADVRINLLRRALEIYQGQNPHTAVYLDAGNSYWLEPGELVSLLEQIDPVGGGWLPEFRSM